MCGEPDDDVVGWDFLAGIVIGAGIQVRDVQPQYLTSS
jgi:hypothetical protein